MGVVLAEMQSGPAGREVELKFLLAEADFSAAQRWAVLETSAPRTQRLKAIYFDTPEGDLMRHGVVLRTRAEGRRRVVACKWHGEFGGGVFERGEREAPCVTAEPDPALLGADVARMIAELSAGRALAPVSATEVKRIAYRLRHGTSEIEIAFDSGVIEAGEQREPVREVEMELKSGDPGALYAVGIAFAEAFAVRIGGLSKAERGALLRAGSPPPVRRAAAVLSGAPTIDAAIGAVMQGCLGQFVGNFPAFAEGDRGRAVHQMRVAMRRLRSVLLVFDRAFPNAAFAAFRAQAREIANAMGEARDWDVFMTLVQEGPVCAFTQEPGFAFVLEEAAQYRDAGYAAVEKLLASAETTRFVLTLQAFLARHGWRDTLSDDALPRLSMPAQEFAAATLARLHHKLLRKGRHFASLSAHDRHELRKDLKKLRYVADLFGGLLELGKYGKLSANLQDELGFFNDLIAAQGMAARLRCGEDVAASRAVGMVLGWCARGAAVDHPGLSEAWERFCKAKVRGF